MSEESTGFLGRWSRRKIDARTREADTRPPSVEPAIDGPATPPVQVNEALREGVARPAGTPTDKDEASPVLPTLDDVQALTRESDYSLFVQRKVSPEVRNAAMKKLFTDPHYNIMDGLDIYIDDYSNPEVMPRSMLRELASARVLNLLTEDELAEDAAAEAAAAATPAEPQASPINDKGKTPAAADTPDMIDSPSSEELTSVKAPVSSRDALPSLDSVAPTAKPYPSGQA